MSKRKKHFGGPPVAQTAAPAPDPVAPSLPPWWTFVLIAAATLLAYWPTLRAGFVWNDSDYVTAPELRSWHGLYRIWFELGATQQYYPLLHSAFWLEQWVWGNNASGYHAINIFLHATSACLLMVLVWRLAGASGFRNRQPMGWGALLAGLIFALHPVCVESVAWITEQKNTLSTVFYFLAGLTFLRWSALTPARLAGTIERSETRQRFVLYCLATLLFLCALLSKSVSATLPGAVLVVTWWRQGRLSWRRDVLPLAPWFVLGAAVGLFTGYVEKKYIGAEGTNFIFTPVDRLLIAGRVIWFYLGKAVWPVHLIFIYPHWKIDPGAVWQYLFPAGVLGLLAVAAWPLRRRSMTPSGRGPLAALLLFIGALFPLLGLFNVYAFIFSYVADHWMYLALPGIIALAALGWAVLLGRASVRGHGSLCLAAHGLALGVLVVLGALTWRECGGYHDEWTFYRTILARNPSSWMARNNLGNLYYGIRHYAEAKLQYEESLRLRPDYPDAHSNLGVILLQDGRVEEAIAHDREALRLAPRYADAHNNYGLGLAHQGHIAEALAEFRTALLLKPRYVEAMVNMGNNLYSTGRREEAIEWYRKALAVDPNHAIGRNNYAVTLNDSGHVQEAIAEFERVLKIQPDYPDARNDYANALRAARRWDEAIAQYREAVREQPNSPLALGNLGNTLQYLGRYQEAIEAFQAALRLDPKNASNQTGLGSTLARVGRTDEALICLREAVALAPDDAQAHNNLGIVLLPAGYKTEAQAEFQAATKLNPNYADAFSNSGVALAELGRSSEAFVQYEHAIRLNPANADVHNNFGVALAGAGRLKEAAAQYREAIRLKPEFVNALQNLAAVLKATGQEAEAAADLRRADLLSRQPQIPHP